MLIRCYEPVQAHQAISKQLWPALKNALMADKRMVVEVREEKRTTEQNRRMWAMLNEIADQVDWHGQKLSADDWKHIFSASLKKQRAVPGLDGGFVVLGTSTSQMSKSELSDLMALIEAFGAERGVEFADAEQAVA